MVSEMQRVAVVVLLSIALANGQAEAKVNANKLSGTLQSLNNQVHKLFESGKTMCVSLTTTSMCIGGTLVMESLGFSEAVRIPMFFLAPSSMLLAFTISGNKNRKQREAEKAVGEAYRSGVKDGFHHFAEKIEEAQLVVIDPGPVEVNDFNSLYDSMFDRLNSPNPEALMKVIPRLDTLVKENGGFPLTVVRDGLSFDSGVFISYIELFGEGNFRHRTHEETSTMEVED